MADMVPITADEIFGGAPTRKPGGVRPITADEVLSPETALGLAGSVTMPEPTEARGSFGRNFAPAMDANLLRDPETARKAIAEHLFPGDPNGASKVGFVDGKPVFFNEKGQIEYVTGGKTNFIANMVANVPEMVAGTVGAFSPSPVGTSALLSTGARSLKNVAVGALYGEPQTWQGNLKDAAIEGGTALATGGIAKGAISAINRGRAIDLTPDEVARAMAVRDKLKADTGIDIDLALASGDNRLLAVRNYLAQGVSSASGKIQAADAAARSQFDDATQRVLDAISGAKPTDELGQAGVNAAQAALKAARKAASDKVRPLYDAAYEAVPFVNDKEVLRFMGLPYFRQAMAAGRRIAALEGRGRPTRVVSAGAPETTGVVSERGALGEIVDRTVTSPAIAAKTETGYSLQDFDYLKQGLDDVAEGLMAKGKRKEAAALIQRKNELVRVLDERSGGAYKAARAAYAQEAKASIEPLENGVVGVLAKIKNPKAATAAAKIFSDPLNVNPRQIQLVRMALAQQDPEAFDGLVRQFVANAWNKARTVTQRANETNAPGKLYQAVWGNENARNNLTAALGQDKAQGFVALMSAAEALSKAPTTGSDTAIKLQIQKILDGFSGFLSRGILSPRESIGRAVTESVADRNALRLWEGLNDPAKVRQLRMALAIPDEKRRIAYLSSFILGDTARESATERQGTYTELPRQSQR